nr:M15 family metallopeptidase [Canibacter zhuwentaonis]
MLVPVAASAASQMYQDVRKATGAGFTICSGYRSYSLQKRLYDREVAEFGLAQGEAYVARPGHSEHQLGYAMDIMGDQPENNCALGSAYAATPAGKWVRENAYKYGFILRYQENLQHIVGFAAEEWHWRYVGVDRAKWMHDKGIKTLEELFELPYAPDYAD